jgi:hypothetical protein
VCADRAAQALRVARAIGVHVFKVIQLFGRDPSRGAVRVRRQRKRNAIAPPSANLGGEQFRVDLVSVRPKKALKPDDVRLDHFEYGETAVRSELSRLRHEVILSFVQQNEQPGFAWLLVIRRITFRAASNGGHADSVGVAEVNFGRENGFAVFHFRHRHPVATPDFPKCASFCAHSSQTVAVCCHGLRADGVQCHEDVVASRAKPTNPVLRRAWSGIAHQCRAFRSSGRERAE